MTISPPEPYEPLELTPQLLVPLGPPPTNWDEPPLPSPPRKSLLDRWFTLTTHLFPAACPRTAQDVSLPSLPVWSPNKAEFMESVAEVVQDLVALKKKQWPGGELDGEPRSRRLLWVCVNRYVRKEMAGERVEGRKRLTLFLAHANGFHKETWEPFLRHLVSSYADDAKYVVDEVWAWEAANHGDACLVNRESLGGVFDWRDNSRDIIQFLTHYLPEAKASGTLPTHLVPIPSPVAQRREKSGFDDRNIVFIGHSWGGCSILRAAESHAPLFRTIIGLDPIVYPLVDRGDSIMAVLGMMSGALSRRDGWSSREEAHKLFAANPFFAAWDPAALEVYVESALWDAPDGKVRLKMPGVLEAVNFAENYTPFETFQLLPTLDDRIQTHLVIAGNLAAWDFERRRKLVWRRRVNTSHTLFAQAGHLIAQEAPAEFAREVHSFLGHKFSAPQALL